MAVKVVDSPVQILFSPVMLTVGNGFTVTILLAVFVHPLLSVAVTVYVVADIGDTFIVAVVALVFQI